jgi:hypothetical protein
MHQIARDRCGKFLSDNYADARTKLLWECDKGHRWKAVPSSIKMGTWCPACARVKKKVGLLISAIYPAF